MMHRSRKQLFARAAFSQKKNGGIRRRHFLNLLADFPDGCVFAHNARKPVPLRVLFAKQQVFALHLLHARRSLHQ
jgi:hypothetical protein